MFFSFCFSKKKIGVGGEKGLTWFPSVDSLNFLLSSTTDTFYFYSLVFFLTLFFFFLRPSFDLFL